mmetsp:Transcript_36937/g.77156  ORF Transcript_36937/g.77156 Transcript_36937/m.77156 type:complete len:119 (-) Transcript_36937:157-513(-)|eukprot:CAMPEP_0172180878 /NCGR_PEP_ID=MMETSP1050-20130122/17500_1 /TAXON_ID=233186 /ORGANISM="Cryptomonas curvata, Strain CCAP979/52" /LENGTH=118 /DNA_ID=CAMNT_0012854085 /DNA_START=14 /DNA_END=370 /DNA_ORIENTATION=-
MTEHILLAHRVSREADILVVEKAIGLLLKGGDACHFLASEDYVALRNNALSENPSKSAVLFGSLKVSTHLAKCPGVQDCTVALSWIMPKTQATPARCAQQAEARERRTIETSKADACL